MFISPQLATGDNNFRNILFPSIHGHATRHFNTRSFV